MTVEAAARVFADAAVWGSLAPVAIGCIRSSVRPTAERAALMWMLAALVMNLWMELSQAGGASTGGLLEIARGLYAVAGMYALGELHESKAGRTWTYAGLATFLCWWLWRASRADHTLAFAAYSGPALYLMLALAGMWIVFVRIRSSRPKPMCDFGLLIGLGTVISYGPAIAIDAASQLFFESSRNAIFGLWALRGIFLIVGLVLFSLAFAWTIPRRSSSGLSP